MYNLRRYRPHLTSNDSNCRPQSSNPCFVVGLLSTPERGVDAIPARADYLKPGGEDQIQDPPRRGSRITPVIQPSRVVGLRSSPIVPRYFGLAP
jgi:hypothetical protein